MNGTVSIPERSANRAVQADGANPLSAAPDKSSSLQAARSLQAIARNLENFLVAQFRQLDELMASRPAPSSSEGSSDVLRAELQRQQAAWERQKNEEFQRIEQERDLLGEAWTRVEAEQRRILAEDALRRAQASNVRELPAGGPARELAAVPTEHAENSRPTDANSSRALDITRDTVLRESALVEYEQLKSDVQRHARRVRQAR
jgi:hypothetical protein